MLPTSTKINSGSGSNCALSINRAGSTETVTTVEIRSSSPTLSKSLIPISTKHCLQPCNDVDMKKGHSYGRTRYQYIRPQTLLTENQQEQKEIDDFTQQNYLVYCDGNLVSGSLEALIEHIVPTWAYYPDSTYIFSFLLSARLFIRPHELLSRISAKWDQHQQEKTCDVVDDAQFVNNCLRRSTSPSISPIRLCIDYDGPSAPQKQIDNQNSEQKLCKQLSAQNCIRFLSEWIETFPYDFRDERLMQQVRILARKCVYIDNALGKKVSCILQLLVQRLTVLEKYEQFLQSLTSAEVHSVKITSNKSVASKTAAINLINPLRKSTETAQAIETDSKTVAKVIGNPNNQTPLQSLLTVGGSSFRTYPIEFNMQNLKPHHHNTQSFKSTNSINSVNLTLHNLSEHFTNSNSACSINDVSGIMDLCPSPAHLAHQLTTIELERLSHIGPEEFVQAFAKEYHASQAVGYITGQDCVKIGVCGTSLSDIKKTRNLESYIQWFNHLSYLTASEIVKYPKKKQRVRIIEYWIETARECFNIGNFNSLVAIIAGLNLAPISRLKKTWSKVQSAKFSVLEHQMDPTSNFNSYRSTLKAAMWRSEGATNERERIIIPFFSLFVKDLYFLNEGCSNRLDNNHINFEKCSQLSKQVMEFNEWKKVSCPFEKLHNVIIFLQSSEVLNENTLSMASFECEPPENTQEKGRYKTLKLETKHQIQ